MTILTVSHVPRSDANIQADSFSDTAEERTNYRTNTENLVKYAKKIEGKLNTAMGLKAMMASSAESKIVREYFTKRMREHILDDRIFEELLPNFAVGCRRLTPGNPFMRAIQGPNVTLHRSAVAKVTGNSVVGVNGDKVDVDTIVCATGFDVSYVPKYSVVGRNGITLQKKWKDLPEGYLGLAVPDMPNYFIFQGPNFPVSNGSVMGPLQSVGAYIIQVIEKMQRDHIHSFAPKQDVTDSFNEHAQTWMRGTCWADRTCRSWYKNNETGRVNSIWPGSSLHYCEMTTIPRFEDYDIRYSSKQNMWAFMGLGFTNNQMKPDGDLSPYIQQDNIEVKFYSFVSSEDEERLIAERKDKVHDLRAKQHAREVNGHV